MVRVGRFCVDRYEMATVDHRTGQPLSPFYPPHPRLIESILFAWQAERRNVGDARARSTPLPELPLVQRTRRDYAPRAVSQRGVLPQAYLSKPLAQLACENAGKRLCTELEWMTACRGQQRRKFPYGDRYEQGRCNVYGYIHPALALHGASSYGHRDPRLNLVEEADGTLLLRRTGSMPGCASEWNGDRIYDLVGNIDEWVEAEKGAFLGGFYARSTREGCEARIGSHPAPYYDYSTGARCCKALDAAAAP
jgi:formylglycine-generating enzyme